MTIYLGLDVHSKATFVFAQDALGNQLFCGEIPTSAAAFADLKDRLSIPDGAAVEAALESGAMAQFVGGILDAIGIKPIVLSAREVRQKARRSHQKSDSRDAFELCDGWRRGIYTAIVWVPSPEIAELRRLVAARASFVADSTAAKNRLKALLRGEGKRDVAAKALRVEKDWKAAVAQLPQGSLRLIAEGFFATWRTAAEQVALLTDLVEQLLIEQFAAETELLTEVPGVGPIVAAGFLAAVGDVSRFKDSAHLASYLGLVPSTYDSGGRERHGRITGDGPAYVRALLCEAAQHASRARNPLNAHFRRLSAKRGRKRAIVAVAHRLARILYQILKTGKRFDVKKLGVEYAPQTTTRKTFYQLKKKATARK